MFFAVPLFTLLLAARSAGGVEVPVVDRIVIEETEEAKALTERKESSYAKTVITKKELEELGGQTAADVLRRLPRIFFSGPPATNKDVRMAGLDKEFQNVLINGNRPPGGGEKREFALDRIPVEDIERIEVLKNPTAAYDSDAVAGIVNIVLKEPPKTQSLSASVSLNYNDLADRFGEKAAASYGDKKGPLGFTIGGVRNREYRGKDKSATDTSKNEREAETEIVRTTTTSANLRLSYEIGENDKITFSPYLTKQSEAKDKVKTVFNLATGAAKNRNNEKEDKDNTLQGYGLEWEHRFRSGSSLKTAASFSENKEDKDKVTAQFTGAGLTFSKNVFENEVKTDRDMVLSADYKTLVSGPFNTEHVLSTGAKYRDKDRDVEKLVYEINSSGAYKLNSTPDDSYSVREKITAFYVMDEASVSDKLVITPGLRVEITDGEYATSGGRQASGDFTDWNPSLHALYKLGGGLQARGSIARTIGRPPFKEKVPTRSVKADKVEEGNPDLSASKSINYEASVEKFVGKTGVVALGAFYKDIDGMIEKKEIGTDTLTGLPVVKPVNVSEAVVKGIEIEAKSGLGFVGLKDFTVNANYSLLDSEVIDPNTGIKRRAKDQPKSVANVVLRYENKGAGLSASVGVNYIGEKIDDSDPTKPRKVEQPFTQWDASFKKSLYKGASVFGSGVNLFAEKKENSDGIKTELEEVGRTFLLGLRYDI